MSQKKQNKKKMMNDEYKGLVNLFPLLNVATTLVWEELEWFLGLMLDAPSLLAISSTNRTNIFPLLLLYL